MAVSNSLWVSRENAAQGSPVRMQSTASIPCSAHRTGPPITGNSYDQYAPTLPGHWLDSLRAFDEGQRQRDYFGAEYCRVYSQCKWHEFKAFNARITPTEYDWYLRNL